MNELRKEFEKLPEIAILLSDGEVYFDESQKKYLCIRQDDGGVEMALWLAWYAYQEQQKKIDGALDIACKHQYSNGERIYNEIKELLK